MPEFWYLAENIFIGGNMLLRNHPLLTYGKNRKWPPVWVFCGGLDDTHPRGDGGILKTVYLSVIKPSTSCS